MGIRRAVIWTSCAAIALYVLLVGYVVIWAAQCWDCADNVGNKRHTWIAAVAILYGPFSILLLYIAAVGAVTSLWLNDGL